MYRRDRPQSAYPSGPDVARPYNIGRLVFVVASAETCIRAGQVEDASDRNGSSEKSVALTKQAVPYPP